MFFMQVVEAGILFIAAKLLSELVNRSRISRDVFNEEVETISATLGLLINIAERSQGNILGLVVKPLPDKTSFLSLLCILIEVALPLNEAHT